MWYLIIANLPHILRGQHRRPMLGFALRGQQQEIDYLWPIYNIYDRQHRDRELDIERTTSNYIY